MILRKIARLAAVSPRGLLNVVPARGRKWSGAALAGDPVGTRKQVTATSRARILATPEIPP
jgi:hypothetical protein